MKEYERLDLNTYIMIKKKNAGLPRVMEKSSKKIISFSGRLLLRHPKMKKNMEKK